MVEPVRGHVLIAGITTRALALSAARAGYRVTAVDAFGDRDLRAVTEVLRPGSQPKMSFSPRLAALAAAAVPAQVAAYTSNFENDPEAVAHLAEGRQLLGNPPPVLERVRNPFELMRVLQRSGHATPLARAVAPRMRSGHSWVIKPRRSGGGHGVKVWRSGQTVPRTMYLQQRLDGIPGSLAFAADGFHAVVLGFSRQLVGDPRFGSRGFRYCGSILGGAGVPLFPHQNELLANAAEVAQTLTREFRLVGLNGVDFIAREGRPFVTEVNPRYSASMELIERSQAVSLFEIHRQACHGVLPDALQPVKTLYGKAVVFARKDLRIAHDLSRTQTGAVADVPHPGERIQRGRPICTVFSIATGLETCRRLLWRRAAAVYRVTEPRPRQAA